MWPRGRDEFRSGLFSIDWARLMFGWRAVLDVSGLLRRRSMEKHSLARTQSFYSKSEESNEPASLVFLVFLIAPAVVILSWTSPRSFLTFHEEQPEKRALIATWLPEFLNCFSHCRGFSPEWCENRCRLWLMVYPSSTHPHAPELLMNYVLALWKQTNQYKCLASVPTRNVLHFSHEREIESIHSIINYIALQWKKKKWKHCVASEQPCIDRYHVCALVSGD